MEKYQQFLDTLENLVMNPIFKLAFLAFLVLSLCTLMIVLIENLVHKKLVVTSVTVTSPEGESRELTPQEIKEMDIKVYKSQ